jgi:hypothetical protein
VGKTPGVRSLPCSPGGRRLSRPGRIMFLHSFSRFDEPGVLGLRRLSLCESWAERGGGLLPTAEASPLRLDALFQLSDLVFGRIDAFLQGLSRGLDFGKSLLSHGVFSSVGSERSLTSSSIRWQSDAQRCCVLLLIQNCSIKRSLGADRQKLGVFHSHSSTP